MAENWTKIAENQTFCKKLYTLDIDYKYIIPLENMAEGQGFEPWIGYKPMPVFKTGAFNRSATPPVFASML